MLFAFSKSYLSVLFEIESTRGEKTHNFDLALLKILPDDNLKKTPTLSGTIRTNRYIILRAYHEWNTFVCSHRNTQY